MNSVLQNQEVDAALAGEQRSGPVKAPANDRFSELDGAYQDFRARREQGEPIDADEFCAQFPSMQSSLGKLIQVNLFLEDLELPEVRWPEVGETFLDFRLILQLGQGAFARVFLATEGKLGNRLVAVKIAWEGAKEAEILGRIQHPNIVPIHSVTEEWETGLSAVCMPYLGGATLHTVQDRAFASGAAPQTARVILDAVSDPPFPLDPSHHALKPDRVFRHGTYVDGVRWIGAHVAQALALLHERGICHRDLKPSNILVSPTGVPMLLDFNLAAQKKDPHNRLGGTIPYMSPEQLRATDPKREGEPIHLDARADLYSLGVILYLLVTGKHPFGPLALNLKCEELRQLLESRQQTPPREARLVNPQVDAPLSQLIQRCLADPAARPQSAAAVAYELNRQLRPVARTRRWLMRHPLAVAAALLCTVTLGLATAAVVVTRPSFADRQLAAGLTHDRQGNFQEALACYNAVLQAEPDNVPALVAQGRAYENLAKYTLAIASYLEADRHAPSGLNLARVGYCLNQNADPNGAVGYYLQALERKHASAAVFNNLGASYFGARKLDKARECLDQAIQLDDSQGVAYQNRARVTLRQATQIITQKKFKAEDVTTMLKKGITDANRAFELGANGVHLHLETAHLHALALQLDPALPKEPALEHCRLAVSLGIGREELRSPLLKSISNEPRFKELLQAPPPAAPALPLSRFINPVQD